MLLRFGVSNHLSIRDLQELSFAASSLKDRDEGLLDCEATPSGSNLPAVVIYGANASGKSNLIDAMQTMRAMVLWSQTRWQPRGGVQRHPFRLDASCSQKPSRFDIDFVIDDVRHHYGFEASDTAFESEWPYTFPKSHRRILFVGDGDAFRFGRGLRGTNNSIARLTRPNSLYCRLQPRTATNSSQECSNISSRSVASRILASGVQGLGRNWPKKSRIAG